MVSKRTWRGMSCEGSSVGVDKRTVWGLFVQIYRSYILIQGGLCAALGQALIHVAGRDPAADCAATNLVTLLIVLSPLIFPTVFHMLINGRIAFLKFTRSCDHVGDQSFGGSPNGFPWSRADWSRGTWEVGRSCDRSGDGITWCFLGSRARGFRFVFVTWL
jgi:hypothetical protein